MLCKPCKSRTFYLEQATKSSRSCTETLAEEWNLRWNRIMATVFCVVIFSLLFAIVVTNTMRSERAKQHSGVQIGLAVSKASMESNQLQSRIDKLCIKIDCGVNCYIMNSKQVANYLNENGNGNCHKLRVYVEKCLFDFPFTIKPGFIASDYPIDQLHLQEPMTTAILPNAFTHSSMKRLNSLTLADSSIVEIRVGVFSGLANLEYLLLHNGQFTEIEFDSFKDLVSLRILKIEDNKKAIPLRHITGASVLPNLETLIFRNSHLTQELTPDTFRGVPNLQNLNLEGSQISVLPGDLELSPSLNVLRLSKNQLRTLPVNTLNQFVKSNVKIYLGENPWHCDCRLSELKSLMVADNDNVFSDNPLCASPTEVVNAEIRAAVFCPEWSTAIPTMTKTTTEYSTASTTTATTSAITNVTSTSAPSTTTTVPTTTPTSSTVLNDVSTTAITTGLTVGEDSTTAGWTNATSISLSTSSSLSPNTSINPTIVTTIDSTEQPSQSELIHVDCEFAREGRALLSDTDLPDPVDLAPQDKRFRITDLASGVVEIEFLVSCTKYVLIYFNSASDRVHEYNATDGEAVSCFRALPPVIAIGNLEMTTSYTFCLIQIGFSLASPFNCGSHYINASPTVDWLSSQSKFVLYSLATVTVMLSFLTGACLAYLVVRRKPTLLRGSNRVIVVKKRSSVVMVMPPNRHSSVKATFSGSSRHPILQRSISDSSVASARSYVSAVMPSPFEVLSWKMGGQRKTNSGSQQKVNPLYLEKGPDKPPPLPPHPCRPDEVAEPEPISGIYECPELLVRPDMAQDYFLNFNQTDGYKSYA